MKLINQIRLDWLMTIIVVLTSCAVEETSEIRPDSYVSFQLADTQQTRAAGDFEDNKVSTLRILAFERTGSRNIVGNETYNLPANIIVFPVKAGTYDFVFLGNEPQGSTTELSSITKRSDLDAIAYPSSAFVADKNIPMMETIENVQAFGDGSGKVNGGATVNPLTVSLDRIAVRLDVTLQAEMELSFSFDQIIITNLPDIIPLTSGYSGTITRNTVRNVNKSDFSAAPISGQIAWAVKKERIILPANEMLNVTDEALAVELTIGMSGNSYSPSCYLDIGKAANATNYSLPKNSHLDFTANITYPLEVNIVASEWGSENHDWEIDGQRILNVSQTSASITDFNGVRISFWSNMPVVRVLPTVQRVDPNNTSLVIEETETNRIFNSLAAQDAYDYDITPQRFNYVTTMTVDNNEQWSGSGYMDILADGWVESDGVDRISRDVTGTYKLTLSAENQDGSNALQREIIVSIQQNGKRLQFSHSSPITGMGDGASGYVGAFWRNSQRGERIITGQHAGFGTDALRIADWSAEVLYEPSDMVILSTTPSQDPNVGTNNPGNAENYPVTKNLQKGETGKAVKGKGRIYFRIGLTGTQNQGAAPRYATVKLKYRLWGSTQVEAILYLRQGEEPDYLFSGRSGSRAFSVYNMTHSSFLSNPALNSFSVGVSSSNAVEVDFPTKGGAHFQWGRIRDQYGINSPSTEPEADYIAFGYRALNPRADMNATGLSGWGWSYFPWSTSLAWKGSTTSVNHGDYYEICPTGYHRPNDGSTAGGFYPSQNSTAGDELASEWRASIYANPMLGDAHELYNPSHPEYNPNPPTNQGAFNPTIPKYYKPVPLPNNVTFGFYADGYFDRRPITRDFVGEYIRYGVGLGTADPANWGTVYFNGNKSIFFPSAGRRDYGPGTTTIKGKLELPGTGYYMTASAADIPEVRNTVWTDWNGVWSIHLSYSHSAPVSSDFKNGFSMRCVKNE